MQRDISATYRAQLVIDSFAFDLRQTPRRIITKLKSAITLQIDAAVKNALETHVREKEEMMREETKARLEYCVGKPKKNHSRKLRLVINDE